MTTTLLKYLLATILLAWLFFFGNLNLDHIQEGFTGWHWLAAALAILANYLCQAIRWNFLLKAQGLTLSWYQTIRLLWIGQFFFMTSLGMVGGEAARGYYICRYLPQQKALGISTVLADRILGLGTYLFLGAFSFLWLYTVGTPPAAIVHFGSLTLYLFLGLALALMLIFSPLFRTFIRKTPWKSLREHMESGLSNFRCGGPWNLLALAASLMTGFFWMTAFLLAAQALNVAVEWHEILLLTPLVVLANSLPVSIGGLGMGEAAAQMILAEMGIPHGAAIMFLVRILMWCIILPLGGIFYAMEKPEHTQSSKLSLGNHKK